jgi:hypothetical protein
VAAGLPAEAVVALGDIADAIREGLLAFGCSGGMLVVLNSWPRRRPRGLARRDLLELQCSMVAAADLAVVARGVVLDEDGEGITSAETLLTQARSIGI